MNGRRVLAVGCLAAWVLCAGLISYVAVAVRPVTWEYPVGVAASLVIGWGLPAMWFGTLRAFPETHSPPASGGAGRRGASGAASGPNHHGT